MEHLREIGLPYGDPTSGPSGEREMHRCSIIVDYYESSSYKSHNPRPQDLEDSSPLSLLCISTLSFRGFATTGELKQEPPMTCLNDR